jgi:ribosomal-protein-alanine N-acetyltransferase
VVAAAPLAIHPLASVDEARRCAGMMASSEPWITLGRDEAACLRTLVDPTRERYVAWRGGELAGFAILCLQGAFVGYLQTLCVGEPFRGQGIGTAMLAFAEERIFRDHPNAFICVSSFNPGARRLYERLGYRPVGELADYVVPGHSEILLRKTRGPLRASAPKDFVPGHLELSGVLRLSLPRARAFPYFSPEGERLFVPGWDPEYLHPCGAPPVDPKGAVFRTRHSGEETLWVVLRHDEEAGRAEYFRLSPGSRLGTVEVHARPAGESTEVDVSYRLTGLSESGNRELASLAASFSQLLTDWASAIEAHAARPESGGRELSAADADP